MLNRIKFEIYKTNINEIHTSSISWQWPGLSLKAWGQGLSLYLLTYCKQILHYLLVVLHSPTILPRVLCNPNEISVCGSAEFSELQIPELELMDRPAIICLSSLTIPINFWFYLITNDTSCSRSSILVLRSSALYDLYGL